MTGGLMQLVSYGTQDIYLMGNPQMTFFKFLYRRHTNFATESIEQSYQGNAAMGRRITCTIERNGDLLQRIYLELEMDDTSITTPYYGYQLIDHIELEIGSQVIEQMTGEWMMIWADLTHSIEKSNLLDNMLGSTTNELYIPLPLWFSKNPGLSLPLIALQYHEVRLHIYFKNQHEVVGNANIDKCSIWCDYVFLDTPERTMFTKKSHEYLIEQIQTITTKVDVTKQIHSQDLKFVHPIKEIIWVIQDISSDVYDSSRYEKVVAANISLNGLDRFKKRKGNYFTNVQRYNCHTGMGLAMVLPYTHIYSFALNPEEHQPSGSCNFSRISNARLNLDLTSANVLPDTVYRYLNIYAVNYNILRIMSGMGGLAYAL